MYNNSNYTDFWPDFYNRFSLNRPAPFVGAVAITAVGKYEDTSLNTLNNEDARILKEFLSSKGWKIALEHYDETVTPEDFIKSGRIADIMYHTGHGGEDGSFPLYKKGLNLSWENIGVLTKTKFIFMMTCNLLNIKNWGSLLRNGAHIIFGYTGISEDSPVDDNIVFEFIAKCYGEGGIAPLKVLDAWESVNSTNNQPYAAIYHRGNVDDYMFGVKSGLTTDIKGLNDIVRKTSKITEQITEDLDEIGAASPAPPALKQIRVEHQKLDFENIANGLLKGRANPSFNRSFGATTYTDQQSNMYIYPTGAMIYEGIRDRNKYKGSKRAAIETASQFIQIKGGGIPQNAYVAEVEEQYELDSSGSQEVVISYMIIFKNSYDNVDIEGDYGDSIKVIVDNSGVSYMFRMWREVIYAKPITGATSINKQIAIMNAEKYYRTVMKTISHPKYEKSSLVYWSESFKKFQNELPIAWKVTLSGRDIFVDANTGDILSNKK